MGGSVCYHKPANRWYVQVYWQRKRYRIWRYNGDPIWHEKTAQKLLNKIRSEIDDGIFQPKTYFPDSPLSLKLYSDQWLKIASVCKNIRKFYKSCLNNHIYKFFGTDFDIRHFTYAKLLEFYHWMPLSEKGKYNVVGTLKTMLRFALESEDIKKVPPFPKLSQALPQEIAYLTFEQQKTILEAIPEWHRPIFEFGMEYGLRVQEVRALMWDCITNTEVIIRRSFSEYELRETTKTGKHRIYGLTSKAKVILERAGKISSYIRIKRGFVFVKNDRGSSYDSKTLNKIWKEAGEKTGIKIKLNNGLRHSLGCQLLDEGIDLETVRDVYGHTTSNMTRRYVQRSKPSITNVLEGRGKVIKFKKQPLK